MQMNTSACFRCGVVESLKFDLRMRPVVIELADRRSNTEGGWWGRECDIHTLRCS
jgi:hypothetical protein